MLFPSSNHLRLEEPKTLGVLEPLRGVVIHWGGAISGRPYNKDDIRLGAILGPRVYGNLQARTPGPSLQLLAGLICRRRRALRRDRKGNAAVIRHAGGC